MVQNRFFYQVLFVHEVAMNLNILGLTMIQNKLMIFVMKASLFDYKLMTLVIFQN